ncbi:unnamed protein product [Echinostoma caproni]|uniref:Lipoprotein n=1 Tax=Echinostoma caproni TaxID=27848 RepID=A0A183B9V8_9TREM|nr:unnamed protein product [Echinostoma caproni]
MLQQQNSALGLNRLFSRERQQQLYLPSGTWMFVKYLNGLQFLGFFCAFFGLINCFLGILDVVIVPAFYSPPSNQFPIRLTLANAYGFPIYSGILIIVAGALALRTVISQRFSSPVLVVDKSMQREAALAQWLRHTVDSSQTDEYGDSASS